MGELVGHLTKLLANGVDVLHVPQRPDSRLVVEHIRYLDLKIGSLNKSLEQIAGGVLDDRDAAADLRDRLQRELDADGSRE